MQGIPFTCFTAEGRHRGHAPVHVWRTDVVRSWGSTGSRPWVGVQRSGGWLHRARFTGFSGPPTEVTMAPSVKRRTTLFTRLGEPKAKLGPTQMPVEFAVPGRPADG